MNKLLSLLRDIFYRYPISGIDFHFAKTCPSCGLCASMCTRGKFVHCYSCGHEFKANFTREQIISCRRESSWHWSKWTKIPYNWHTLSEDEKIKCLKRKRSLI